jgi:hypothetical protein
VPAFGINEHGRVPIIMESLAPHPSSIVNPIDLLEELVSANDWPFDRSSECEMAIELSGRWCAYHLWFAWHEQVGGMYFSSHFDLKVPRNKYGAVHALIGGMNEQLWMGHFELAMEEGQVVFRHTIPYRGTTGPSVEQLEDLMDTAILECERFYPALQMVIWAGHSVPEALATAMLDTVGEA